MKPNPTVIASAVAALSRQTVSGPTTPATVDAASKSAMGSGSSQQTGQAAAPATSDCEGHANSCIGSGVFAGVAACCLAVTSRPAPASPAASRMARRIAGKVASGAHDQLESREVVADPGEVGPIAANDDGHDVQGPPRTPGQLPMERAIFANVIGPRLLAARRLNGLAQTELARQMGYRTPAQLNQWETGRRPVPLPMLIRLATALCVSADYLLGLTDLHEHDPSLARRAALQRSVRAQLDTVIDAVTQTFEKHSALESPVEVSRLVRAAERVVSAVSGFIDANEDAFLDMPRGASVAHASRELGEVVAEARDRMDLHSRFETELQTTLKQARFGA